MTNALKRCQIETNARSSNRFSVPYSQPGPRAQNYNASLTLKVELNFRFSLKSTKVYYNRFSYFKVDLNLRKYLNI